MNRLVHGIGCNFVTIWVAIVASFACGSAAYASESERSGEALLIAQSDSGRSTERSTSTSSSVQVRSGASRGGSSVSVSAEQRSSRSGSGESGARASSSSENPPGFYVPVRPTYSERRWTVRATAFTSNFDMFSLSVARSYHPTFDIEAGLWMNPFWCRGVRTRCRPGEDFTTWGAFLHAGISRKLADQRGLREKPWAFEVPFHVEFRFFDALDDNALVMGFQLGIEFVRFFQPNRGLAIKITGGSGYLDLLTLRQQGFDFNIRGSLGITF